jgi:hypothetical protein
MLQTNQISFCFGILIDSINPKPHGWGDQKSHIKKISTGCPEQNI